MNSRSRAENWSRNALSDYNKKYSAKHLRDVSYIKFYIIILLFAAYTYITGYVGFVLALNLFRFILCVLFPFYYILHPLAAIRSMYKLYTEPYKWEKTCKKEFIIK